MEKSRVEQIVKWHRWGEVWTASTEQDGRIARGRGKTKAEALLALVESAARIERRAGRAR